MMVQQNAAGSLRVSLNSPFLHTPGLWDQGVDMSMRRQTLMVGSTSATVFRGHDGAWPSEETFLDSRFRGNDRARGVQRGEAPLRYLFTPMSRGQRVDLR
jgi:hypothetical protein